MILISRIIYTGLILFLTWSALRYVWTKPVSIIFHIKHQIEQAIPSEEKPMAQTTPNQASKNKVEQKIDNQNQRSGIILKDNKFINNKVGISMPKDANVKMDGNRFIDNEKSIDIRDTVTERAALSTKQDTDKQLKEVKDLLLNLINTEHSVSGDLYIKSINIYWIEEREDFYRIGLLLRVLNKNNTRSYVVNAMGYKGDIDLTARSTVSFRNITTGQNMFGNSAVVKKQYFIKPGVETCVDFELDKEVIMIIADKNLPPTLRFNFKWFLDLDKDGFLEIRSSQGGPLCRRDKYNN